MKEVSATPYKITFDRILNDWDLTGPVGARGVLRFGTANEAANYARWAASLQDGGVLEIRDKAGNIFRTEKLQPKATTQIVDSKLPLA